MANVFFDSTFTKDQFQERVRADFTARASRYDGEPSGAMGPSMRCEIIDRLLELYPPRSPVLDVACGTGHLCGSAVRSGCEATGLDITAAMLVEGRRNYPTVNFVEGRAENLPFPDNSFSSVYISSAIVYFTDIPAALREVWRVLRPGGFLAFQATSGDSYVIGIAIEEACSQALGVETAQKTFRVPGTATNSPVELTKLLDEAGFQSVEESAMEKTPILDVDMVLGTWDGGLFNNAFMTRFGRLSAQQKEEVRKKFLGCIEKYRGDDGVLRDKILHWFVRGWKSPVLP